jgi:hypothetical protein
MEDFDLSLAINGTDIQVKVHPHVEGEVTYYDIVFENYSLSIYKDTLYTWKSDDPHGLSQADIQSIGEQLQNVD